jgi:hypothetical protein
MLAPRTSMLSLAHLSPSFFLISQLIVTLKR